MLMMMEWTLKTTEYDIENRTFGGLTFQWGVFRTLHQIRQSKETAIFTAYVRHYSLVPSPDFASLIVLIFNRSASAADPPCVSGGRGWASEEAVGARIVRRLDPRGSGEDEDVVEMPNPT
jgi:hypothetical protein